MTYGQRVRQLRVMRGMTQVELADRVLTSQDQLSRLERAEIRCDGELEQMLAAELGVTADYLRRPPTASLEAHSPQFRARSRVPKRDRAAALEWARLVDEEYSRLITAATPIPPLLNIGSGHDPVTAAHVVRDRLGFNQHEPLPYLVLAVERLGVRLFGLPWTASTVDGFSAWQHDSPIVGILAGVPADRTRFTVAHELGHLVLHQSNQTGSHLETEADQFAAELLTPEASIAKVLPAKPTLSSMTMLKSQWGVSIKVLVRRARELEIIDADRAVSLYKQISKRGWNKKEPGFVPAEKPRGFRKLIELSYGLGPNVERFASDAAWSHELALEVLNEHATSEELPRRTREESPASSHDANIIYLGDHKARRGTGVPREA
jgi:Zn-dependent peptidase ImmA (M78 family)/transcriptional regulator with XRE-family HTH domain